LFGEIGKLFRTAKMSIAGKRLCVGVAQMTIPIHDASQIDPRIAAGLHRLETVEKSAFGRKTLSHPGYGPKYGLKFFSGTQKRKSPE
jgi:hypothetical protein